MDTKQKQGESGDVSRQFGDIGVKNVSFRYKQDYRWHVQKVVLIDWKIRTRHKANQNEDDAIYNQIRKIARIPIKYINSGIFSQCKVFWYDTGS